MPAGVEVAYFTLAERTLFWINTLLTGHGPEQIASRLEKYRSAHHCELAVEAEDGISLEWHKEDYEISRVECFNRKQEEPSKVQLSYSCKPANFGGLLEGVVVLQVLVEPKSSISQSEPAPSSGAQADSSALSEPAALPQPPRLAASVAAASIETPERQPAESSAAERAQPVLSQMRSPAGAQPPLRKETTEPTAIASGPSGKTSIAPSHQAAAGQTHLQGSQPLNAPARAMASPSSSTAAKRNRDNRADSALDLAKKLWQRCWRPRRQAEPSLAKPAPAPTPPPAPVAAPPVVAAPKLVVLPEREDDTKSATDTAVQASEALPDQRTSTHHATDAGPHSSQHVLPVPGSDEAVSTAARLQDMQQDDSAHVTSGAQAGDQQELAVPHITSEHASGGNVTSLVAANGAAENLVPQTQPRTAFCAIYFSVDPLNTGNRFGVCCNEDDADASPVSEAGGDAHWWTVCTRRGGKVERSPAKVACWRASVAGSNAELKASRPVFGAHERMPPRRQCCIDVSVSAEMTSCLDATLKVKLKHCDPVADTSIIIPSSTVVMADTSLLTPPPALAELGDSATKVADSQLSRGSQPIVLQRPSSEQATEPGPVLPIRSVGAEEVILDVKPVVNVSAASMIEAKAGQVELQEAVEQNAQAQMERNVMTTAVSENPDECCRAKTTLAEPPTGVPEVVDQTEAAPDLASAQDAHDIKSGSARPEDKPPPSSLPSPWEVLRGSPLQQTHRFVWNAIAPERAALTDTEQKPADIALPKAQPLGSTLLTVASTPPLMGRNDAPVSEVHVTVPDGCGGTITVQEQVVTKHVCA